jgi:hypothetical protein
MADDKIDTRLIGSPGSPSTASRRATSSNSIERWEDWCSAWSKRAKVHEDLRRDSLAARRFVSAGEHLSRAAVTYHLAKYLFVKGA